MLENLILLIWISQPQKCNMILLSRSDPARSSSFVPTFINR